MSFLWRLLSRRAGDQDLPPDLGPDPAPDEDELLAEEEAVLPFQDRLSREDFQKAAIGLHVEMAVIRAVAEVEAAGRGFLADGRPQILYEAHIFHRQTSGKYARNRDRRGVALSVPNWDRSLYGRTGSAQYERLEDAAALDWGAAHRSASWGLFQIMGFNHPAVGFATIDFFVSAMNRGAGPHLDAFVEFIRTNRLDGPLRRKDWTAFARGYNGPGFAQNQYDKKLEAAYQKWSAAEASV